MLKLIPIIARGALKESTAKLSVLTRSPRARIVGPANMEVLLLVLVPTLPVSNVKEDVLVLLLVLLEWKNGVQNVQKVKYRI